MLRTRYSLLAATPVRTIPPGGLLAPDFALTWFDSFVDSFAPRLGERLSSAMPIRLTSLVRRLRKGIQTLQSELDHF